MNKKGICLIEIIIVIAIMILWYFLISQTAFDKKIAEKMWDCHKQYPQFTVNQCRDLIRGENHWGEYRPERREE